MFGRWVEEGGPRSAMFTAALCWAGGFLLARARRLHPQLWLIYLGYGVLGGIGLGIGYISPVSTLIKWFPDRPGMATGMAIMGFGGGAFIASPLSVWLMNKFTHARPTSASPRPSSSWAAIYFCLHDGRLDHRPRAAAGLAPGRLRRADRNRKAMITRNDVFVYDALKTPQFWLIWWVLCLNVTAGIGVLGQASP